jgi:hypothetical protein
MVLQAPRRRGRRWSRVESGLAPSFSIGLVAASMLIGVPICASSTVDDAAQIAHVG